MPRSNAPRRPPRRPRLPRSRGTRAPRTVLDRIRAFNLGDVADGARAAYTVASELLNLNTEVKYIDASVGAAAQTWAGVVSPVSLLAGGTTNNTRTGESVRAHGLELRWKATSAGATINFVRVVAFVDNECRGVAPVPADVLETIGAASTPIQPWNALNVARFGILYDSGAVGLDPAGKLTTAATVLLPVNHHIHYDGAAGAIANSYEGNIFILTIADIAAAGPVLDWFTRLHFVDN